MEKHIYNLVLEPGTDEAAFLSGPAAGMQVKSNLDMFDGLLCMLLTQEEASQLESDPNVKEIQIELQIIETSYPTTTLQQPTTLITRTNPSILSDGADYAPTHFWYSGEQGGTANTGPIGFFTPNGEDALIPGQTISQRFAGQYIDIVAIEAGTPTSANDSHETHPDFLDDQSNTRFVRMDWSEHDSGASDAANNQATNGTTFLSDHAIGVLSAAGGTYCGWCKVSSLRVIYLADGVSTAYNAVLAWHNSKPINPATGVRNPTVTTGAWGFSGIEHVGAILIDNINSITVGGGGTITKPGGGWGTDFTPFVDNLLVPRVINDPADSIDKWAITYPLSFRNTSFDTIMNNYDSAGGIYHFKSAGNNAHVAVPPNDPRWNTRLSTTGTNIQISLDGDGNYFFGSATAPSTVYPLRTYSEGSTNMITVAACQNSTINPLLDDYSNRGPCVDVAGLGSYTWTSYPTLTYQDGKWGYFSGTSCAAPQAAGAAGIMIENFLVQRGVYPSTAQVKEMITKHSKEVLQGESTVDFSNVPSAGNFSQSRLTASLDVYRITEGSPQNGSSDLSDLHGTPTDRIFVPWGIYMGTGQYIADPRGPNYGKRPSSGQTYPRRKITVGA